MHTALVLFFFPLRVRGASFRRRRRLYNRKSVSYLRAWYNMLTSAFEATKKLCITLPLSSSFFFLQRHRFEIFRRNFFLGYTRLYNFFFPLSQQSTISSLELSSTLEKENKIYTPSRIDNQGNRERANHTFFSIFLSFFLIYSSKKPLFACNGVAVVDNSLSYIVFFFVLHPQRSSSSRDANSCLRSCTFECLMCVCVSNRRDGRKALTIYTL